MFSARWLGNRSPGHGRSREYMRVEGQRGNIAYRLTALGRQYVVAFDLDQAD